MLFILSNGPFSLDCIRTWFLAVLGQSAICNSALNPEGIPAPAHHWAVCGPMVGFDSKKHTKPQRGFGSFGLCIHSKRRGTPDLRHRKSLAHRDSSRQNEMQ